MTNELSVSLPVPCKVVRVWGKGSRGALSDMTSGLSVLSRLSMVTFHRCQLDPRQRVRTRAAARCACVGRDINRLRVCRGEPRSPCQPVAAWLDPSHFARGPSSLTLTSYL